MTRFLLGRLSQSLVVLLVMSFAIYGLIGLMPGDPIDLMISANPELSPADAQRLKALYGLDRIAEEMFGASTLQSGMEALMLKDPSHWQRYYHGDEVAQRLHRHYSYSDRIRYYWAMPQAQALVETLFQRFGTHTIPETLISQYLPGVWQDVAGGRLAPQPRSLLIAAIGRVLDIYGQATGDRRRA